MMPVGGIFNRKSHYVANPTSTPYNEAMVTTSSPEYWEEWLNRGELIPYYQPIFEIQTRSVLGYEVLGRMKHPDGKVVSLGPFFNAKGERNPDGTDSLAGLKRTTDRIIREKALQQIQEMPDDGTRIFLNITPSLLVSHLINHEDEVPYTVQLTRKNGLNPYRVVIELTEESVEYNLPELLKVLGLYRLEGFSIALDDVGSQSSNLDRLGHFHPEIIKIDLEMLRHSVTNRNFKEILNHLARLAASLGSKILFEGIETKDELFSAFSSGARYLQGFLLSKPLPRPESRLPAKEQLDLYLKEFYQKKYTEVDFLRRWEEGYRRKLSALPWESVSGITPANLPENLLAHLDRDILKVFITDGEGHQISPNYRREEDGRWSQDGSYLGRIWCTRPYFFDHIHQRGAPGTWTFSQEYMDLENSLLIRTLASTREDGSIVFLDVLWTPA